MKLIPQAREPAHRAAETGKTAEAKAVNKVIDGILKRPEHAWFAKHKSLGLKKKVK